MALQRLKEAAEKAKIELSGLLQTNINLPFISATSAGPVHLDMTLTRAKFNELTADLVEKPWGPCARLIRCRAEPSADRQSDSGGGLHAHPRRAGSH